MVSIALVVLGSFISWMVFDITAKNKTQKYCGIVKEKRIDQAGYKVSAKDYIIFRSEELQRNIAVNVTKNTYYNTSIGERVCFNLTERQTK